jgi:hypothetical protein
MTKTVLLIFVSIALSFSVACAKQDNEAPRVIGTHPANQSQDVDPLIGEISVTFNEEMTDGNWSWAYEDKSMFPQISGQAYYTDNNTRNILPVKLESNKEYVIWINTEQFRNFKDKSGNPAFPFKFTFKTR